MKNIINRLENNEEIENKELIDYAIAVQLAKIEKYNSMYNSGPSIITENTEHAMANLIELLKIRKGNQKLTTSKRRD